jgi:hypothetical protein
MPSVNSFKKKRALVKKYWQNIKIVKIMKIKNKLTSFPRIP